MTQIGMSKQAGLALSWGVRGSPSYQDAIKGSIRQETLRRNVRHEAEAEGWPASRCTDLAAIAADLRAEDEAWEGVDLAAEDCDERTAAGVFVVDHHGARLLEVVEPCKACDLPDCPVCAIANREVADVAAWRARRLQRRLAEGDLP